MEESCRNCSDVTSQTASHYQAESAVLPSLLEYSRVVVLIYFSHKYTSNQGVLNQHPSTTFNQRTTAAALSQFLLHMRDKWIIDWMEVCRLWSVSFATLDVILELKTHEWVSLKIDLGKACVAEIREVKWTLPSEGQISVVPGQIENVATMLLLFGCSWDWLVVLQQHKHC